MRRGPIPGSTFFCAGSARNRGSVQLHVFCPFSLSFVGSIGGGTAGARQSALKRFGAETAGRAIGSGRGNSYLSLGGGEGRRPGNGPGRGADARGVSVPFPPCLGTLSSAHQQQRNSGFPTAPGWQRAIWQTPIGCAASRTRGRQRTQTANTTAALSHTSLLGASDSYCLELNDAAAGWLPLTS